MARTLLTSEEVSNGLGELDADWTGSTSGLHRKVTFPSFMAAVDFVGRMAPEAERLDHHPDLKLSWRTVELELSTHSAGGVTELDFQLAKALDPLIDTLGG